MLLVGEESGFQSYLAEIDEDGAMQGACGDEAGLGVSIGVYFQSFLKVKL